MNGFVAGNRTYPSAESVMSPAPVNPDDNAQLDGGRPPSFTELARFHQPLATFTTRHPIMPTQVEWSCGPKPYTASRLSWLYCCLSDLGINGLALANSVTGKTPLDDLKWPWDSRYNPFSQSRTLFDLEMEKDVVIPGILHKDFELAEDIVRVISAFYNDGFPAWQAAVDPTTIINGRTAFDFALYNDRIHALPLLVTRTTIRNRCQNYFGTTVRSPKTMTRNSGKAIIRVNTYAREINNALTQIIDNEPVFRLDKTKGVLRRILEFQNIEASQQKNLVDPAFDNDSLSSKAKRYMANNPETFANAIKAALVRDMDPIRSKTLFGQA
ncbi:hypothetical protein AAL_00319 [Moelleriella libera RCEF 2490]|uniref:Uncharacterized protein n=1 Tax=Moelleriella libera RCEF 2490 TaxID=1081109 RepID=A0A166UR20_9HYPO|nr:hypothetical protein AAL_00319 [Moelleriella libera RCEF 2490]